MTHLHQEIERFIGAFELVKSVKKFDLMIIKTFDL
jgi:hypothetical protein